MNSPAVVDKPAAGDIRLNLGGRDTKIEGFKTIDLYEGPSVDVVADISKLTMFEDGTVNEIYASHCLEHFPHPQTGAVLKEWRRVLRPGGRCFIGVPDFDAAAKLYAKDGLTDLLRNLLWGDQGYPLAYHYAGFTFGFLAKSVTDAGFSDVKRVKYFPHGVKDCSWLMDTIYKQPLSLNIEAIA